MHVAPFYEPESVETVPKYCRSKRSDENTDGHLGPCYRDIMGNRRPARSRQITRQAKLLVVAWVALYNDRMRPLWREFCWHHEM